MAFQFRCPQGHLLEGDPSHAGQQVTCPQCGQLFIIPEPPPGYSPDAAPGPSAVTANPFEVAETPSNTGFDVTGEGSQSMLHIPCPNGHELETPREMLEQDVLCPHCGVQYRLRERDSVEYKRKKKIEMERREHKLGNMWLNGAVVVAVLVVIGIIVMIVMSANS